MIVSSFVLRWDNIKGNMWHASIQAQSRRLTVHCVITTVAAPVEWRAWWRWRTQVFRHWWWASLPSKQLYLSSETFGHLKPPMEPSALCTAPRLHWQNSVFLLKHTLLFFSNDITFVSCQGKLGNDSVIPLIAVEYMGNSLVDLGHGRFWCRYGSQSSPESIRGWKTAPKLPREKGPSLYFLGVKPVQSDLQLVRE